MAGRSGKLANEGADACAGFRLGMTATAQRRRSSFAKRRIPARSTLRRRGRRGPRRGASLGPPLGPKSTPSFIEVSEGRANVERSNRDSSAPHAVFRSYSSSELTENSSSRWPAGLLESSGSCLPCAGLATLRRSAEAKREAIVGRAPDPPEDRPNGHFLRPKALSRDRARSGRNREIQ